MRTISGCGNWKLTYRRDADEITILRAVTCDTAAVLPDTIDDRPVVRLGDRALSPNARPLEGEQLVITCGSSDREWNNRNIKSLQLPEKLRAIENYAMYNCVSLEHLKLRAGITERGTCVFMNCRAFRTAELQMTEDPLLARTICFLAEEFSSALDLTIRPQGQEAYRLMLPEYLELYEENAAAHHFELNISGAGYPYHSVFEQGSMNFSEYDGFWERFLSMEHNAGSALKVAWYRVRTPKDLGNQAKERYERYLKEHLREVFPIILKENDEPGLKLMLTYPEAEGSILSEFLQTAREQGKTWATAMLLGRNGKSVRASGFQKSFDL